MRGDKIGDADPIFLAAVVGFALFTAATWTGRSDAVASNEIVLYLARFSKIAAYMGIAFLFRNHIPSVSRLMAFSCVALALHIGCECLSALVGGEPFLLLGVSSVAEGVAGAGVLLVFAHVISTFRPQRSAVAFAVGFTLNELIILVLQPLSSELVFVLRIVFKVFAAFLLLLLVLAMLARAEGERSGLPGGKEGEIGDHPLQYGMSRREGEVDRPLSFLSTGRDWVLLLIVSALFPTLFGLVAQLSSGGSGAAGLYDAVNEAIAVAMMLVLVLIVFCRYWCFAFSEVITVCAPLFIVGCAAFPSLWLAGSPFAGTLVKLGWTLFNALLMILMARKAYEDPRHTYLYFGLFCGVSTAQFGRLAGTVIRDAMGVSYEVVANVALTALCLVALMVLATFVVSRRSGMGWNGDLDGGEALCEMPADTVDSFTRKLEQFCEQYGITPREREVMVETMHGYSRGNVAKKLLISPETVKTYLGRCYNKAAVSSKQELIRLIESMD